MIESKPPKPKPCAHCKEKFTPQKMGQKVCSPKCALAIAPSNRDKAEKALERQRKAEHREAKENVKPKGQYAKEAQSAFNAWIRLRDADKGCVSCDKPATWSGQWHASHFLSVGSSPEHRFNPDNVHKACSICNNHLSGNILGFKPELERRIGVEALEILMGLCEPKRYTIEDLKAITAEYRDKVRELKAAQG